MSFINFLLESYLSEAVIDNVIKSNPDVDPSIIKHYDSTALPEHAKNNLDWVIRQHKKGNITPEDAHTLKPLIATFTAHKDKIGENINKFDVNGLKAATSRFMPTTKTTSNNVKNIYEDDDIIVKQHKGADAISDMGSLPKNNPYHNECDGHAKWCISLRGGANKAYVKQYTDGGKHPVYSIENKHTGRKYALVADPTSSSPEFRDEKDQRPNMSEFLMNNPSILKTKPGKFLKDHFDEAKDFADTFKDHDVSKLTSNDIRDLYHKHLGNSKITDFLVSQKNAPKDILEHDYSQNKESFGRNISFPSLANPNFPKDKLTHLIEHGTKNNGEGLEDIASHAHLEPHHIDKLLDYDKESNGLGANIGYSFSKNEKLHFNDNQKDRIIKQMPSESSFLLKKETNPHMIEKITHNHIKEGDINTIIGKKDILPETYHHIINHYGAKNQNIMNNIINSPHTKKHFADSIINDEPFSKLNNLKYLSLKNTDFSKDDQHKIADHLLSKYGQKSIPHQYLFSFAENKNLHPEVANKIYDHYKSKGIDSLSDRLDFKANITKLSKENQEDRFKLPNAEQTIQEHADFTKHPELFDKVKNSYWISNNRTLTPDMISHIHKNRNITDTSVISMPNTPDDVLKGIITNHKSLTSKILDKPNVSPDVLQHTANTYFSPSHVGILKKVLKHPSTGAQTFGHIIRRLGQKNVSTPSPRDTNFKKDVVHELYKNNDKLTNKQLDSVISMPMHQKTIKIALKDGVSDKHIHSMLHNNHSAFQSWEGSISSPQGSHRAPSKEMFENIMKSPNVGKDSLSYMLDNKDTFIPKGQENLVIRKLHEVQGQQTLDFSKGKKK